MTREEAHKSLLGMRDRAARQPISYKPLFEEAADLAADLLHELCEMDVGMPARHLRTRYFISQYTDGPATRWNVIDRQTQEWIRRFPTEAEAQAHADKLNGARA